MIVSDKYKYVFLETPHTGSTAISKELVENYGGKKILHKHANYHEFLKIATNKQKKYFVFAGVRDPLDEAVSLYNKFLGDHKSNYTDPRKLLKNGGWVTERKIKIYELVQSTKDFEAFLKGFYTRVYTNNINVNKNRCDYIMRFERLDKDFSKALKELGIKKKRPLPIVNKTKNKSGFASYYKGGSIDYAVKIFSPFMKEWSYEFPKEWGSVKTSAYGRFIYSANKAGRTAYSKYVKEGPLKKLTVLRNALE